MPHPNDSLLPEGLSFSPGGGVQTPPNVVPEGADNLLPPGLSFSPSADTSQRPAPAPPPPTQEEQPQHENAPPEQPEDETPGFWQTIGSAFKRKMAERAVSDVLGAQAAAAIPSGTFGATLEQMRQSDLMHPKTRDAVDELIDQDITQGWTNPKWWGAQLAATAGGVVPGLAAAGAASLT